MLKIRGVEVKREPVLEFSHEGDSSGNLRICVERTDSGSPSRDKFILAWVSPSDGSLHLAGGLNADVFGGALKIVGGRIQVLNG